MDSEGAANVQQEPLLPITSSQPEHAQKPDLVHWSRCDFFCLVIFGVVLPITCLFTTLNVGGNGGTQYMSWGATLIMTAVGIYMLSRPCRHEFTIRGDDILYKEYRWLGIPIRPKVRAKNRHHFFSRFIFTAIPYFLVLIL
jgi:hypothetical protein